LLPEYIKKTIVIAKEHPLLSGLTLFYIATVIFGAYRFYSPIPQGDMWSGYLDFYLRVQDGDNSAWWAQHNEHRPIFSRMLFYLDLEFFSGLSALLIIINVILLMLVWGMLIFNAHVFARKKTDNHTFFYLMCLITIFAFSWKQDENITWGFQSQFWAAYLFPLLAFYFLGLSEKNKKNEIGYYILACLFGIMSAGTMANGIFALPLLVVMALLLNKGLLRTASLFVISLIVAALYINYYQHPGHHGSIITNITQSPLQTIVFFIEYLGSPIKNIYLSFLLGVFHLFLITMILKNISQFKNNPIYLSVVAFILYYLASVVVISVGRVDFGMKAALVGRYTTPSIISLMLSIVLYLSVYPKYFRLINIKVITTIAILMLGTQVRTIIKNVDKLNDVENIRALQLEIGTYSAVGSPGTETWQGIADRARVRGVSIFGIEPFRMKREKLATILDTSPCRKVAYRVSDQPDDIYRQEFKTTRVLLSEILPSDSVLYVTNQHNRLIGFGLLSKAAELTANLVFKDYNFTPDENTSLYSCR
jgi:hypothetical protein